MTLTQSERLDWLIDYLLHHDQAIPGSRDKDRHSARFHGARHHEPDAFLLPEQPWNEETKQSIWRGLVNQRAPRDIDPSYLAMEDVYLEQVRQSRPLITLQDLDDTHDPLYLYQGDITLLAVDAIVNAANSDMLGCFIPNHHCIDNQIHTYAGTRLRLWMNNIMQAQGRREPVGKAKISPGFQLPAQWIIHTVGPMVTGEVNGIKQQQLAQCYESCLAMADAHQLQSIAFCCISTGEFGYPKQAASILAVETVTNYLKRTQSSLKVIFNVFNETDYQLYRQLLEQGE